MGMDPKCCLIWTFFVCYFQVTELMNENNLLAKCTKGLSWMDEA